MKTFALVAFALTSLTLTACGGDDGDDDGGSDDTKHPDAAVDAASGDAANPDATPDAMPDAPTGTACTGALYDPCTTNTQCTGAMCKEFNGSGFSVCTQACSGANPCPTQNGAAVQCNGMGICKPNSPNVCTR